MTILMQSETIENLNDSTELCNVLSWFSDEDFNGNNGESYLCEEAKKLGYDSNQEYVLCHFVDKDDLTPKEKIRTYFEKWLDGDSYYADFDWILHENKDNTYTLTLARVTED